MIYIGNDGFFSVNLAAEGVAPDADVTIEFHRLLGDSTTITPTITAANDRFFKFFISVNNLSAGQYVLRFVVDNQVVYSESATVDVSENTGVDYVAGVDDFEWAAPTFVDGVKVGFDYNFDFNFE